MRHVEVGDMEMERKAKIRTEIDTFLFSIMEYLLYSDSFIS